MKTKKPNIKERIDYWLDKQMSKGTGSMVRLLSFAVILVVILISVLIVSFDLKEGIFSAFWDSLATIVNAWMPSSEDGEIGYIVLNTITAIVGLFFTSILIGIISSAIEEKLSSLREGSSIVLEKDHTVILGYNLGEHGLLKQLMISAGRKHRCFVVFSDIEKSKLENDIKNNITIPDNIEILCRHGDITSINDLRCCSIEHSKTVIINALNDNRRIKAILAVSMLKKEYPECSAKIVACVSNEQYMLPRNKIGNKKMIMIKTDDFMAQIIARTATEPGLSIAFKELLNFEGNELYLENDERFCGRSVLQLSGCIDNAVLIGIKNDDVTILNPSRDTVIKKGDEVILFEKNKGAYRINEIGLKNIEDRESRHIEPEDKGHLYIFGSNVLLKTIISELPDDVDEITVLLENGNGQDRGINDTIRSKTAIRTINIEKELALIASDAKHIVILADRNIVPEDSDIKNILLLLKLMNLKENYNYPYNITIELNMENSYNVSLKHPQIDYIVSSNIASLILAQMAENPDLESAFDELLSKSGNELYSKPLKQFNLSCAHDYSCAGLKQITLSYGFTLLGFIHGSEMRLNPKLEDRILFDADDRLIVLGRE